MDAGTARSKFGVLLTASMVSSLIMLDSNIVAVSLPSIARSLGASFQDVQWVISAYLVAYAALLLAAGALADLWGRKKAMISGLIIFGLASAMCGLATSSLMLNVARAVQGVGGSLLLTSSLAIVTHSFGGAERTRAFAVWGAWIGVALVAGPILGGFITSLAGWRWVFLVNIPVCVVLIVATLMLIEESKDDKTKQLDFAGVVTFSPGLFLFIWALIDGNDAGWGSVSIIGRLIGAAVFFVSFGFIERRQERPMIDFSLFSKRPFLGAFFAMLGYGAVAQVLVFTLPVFLQNVYDFAPAMAGLAMLPFALPMVLVPRLMARHGTGISGRARLTIGLAIATIGNAIFFLSATLLAPYIVFVLGMLVAGIGAGILNGETVKVMGNAVPPERAGMASGVASTTRFIGILVSSAALGAILFARLNVQFADSARQLGAVALQATRAARLIVAGNEDAAMAMFAPALRVSLRAAGRDAFAHGFATGALVLVGVAAIACGLAFRFVEESQADGAHVPVSTGHCQTIDCRHPI